MPATFKEWRHGQFEAIQQSKASKERIVGQAAPTGVGKSLILMGEALMTQGRSLILTSTKQLQDQYVETFQEDRITDLRGQQNYLCLALQAGGEHYAPYVPSGASVDEGPCHFGQGCSLLLGGCLYYDKVRKASQAPSVLTNYDLALAIAKYSEGIGLFNFIACDEAHEIPEKLASIMAAEVTIEQAKLLNTELFPSTDPLIWASWAFRHRVRVSQEVEGIKESGQSNHPESRYRLKKLIQLQHVLGQMADAEEDWIVDIGEKKVRLEPLWPRKFAEPYLFGGAAKIVLASATIRPKTFDLLGVKDFDFFEYDSPFDVKRRPVYYVPTTTMRYDMELADKLRIVRAVDQIIARRLDRKIIIPTTSFALQKFLVANSRFGRFMLTNKGASFDSRSDTPQVIRDFKAAKAPCILVSPSISTGVDFPYSDCETIIIIKVPFPDISSRVYQARSADDRAYGPYIAIQTLVQMAGRGMRAADDRCETIILDQTLGGLLFRYRDLFPRWFLTAIQKRDTIPQPLEKL